MENNIGVGILVGIATASSMYVWKSESFTKTQKTFLLLSVLFPPLQWVGILAVSLYNNYKINNTTEKITEKKIEQVKNELDNSILNLKDLKDKGILTEEEYNLKVEKINAEKEEQSIKNSQEYKQLKSLLDKGILTKEEFENKVQIISNISNKEINKKEIDDIINSVNETYLAEIKDNEETKKENSTSIYIFSILFFIILIGGTIFLSYYNSNDTNVDSNYSEPMVVDTISTYQNNYQETIKIKKFVYVVLKIEKPNLDVYESTGFTNSAGFYETFDPIYSIKYEKETYTTDIIEIGDYNIDEKYKIIDDAKNKMYSQLKFVDDAFSTNLWVKCKDDNKREEFKGIRSKITDSQIFEFDSYSEASIHKQNNSE